MPGRTLGTAQAAMPRARTPLAVSRLHISRSIWGVQRCSPVGVLSPHWRYFKVRSSLRRPPGRRTALVASIRRPGAPFASRVFRGPLRSPLSTLLPAPGALQKPWVGGVPSPPAPPVPSSVAQGFRRIPGRTGLSLDPKCIGGSCGNIICPAAFVPGKMAPARFP
jgi:hypothetical protein